MSVRSDQAGREAEHVRLAAELASIFRDRAVVRRPSRERREIEGEDYHKGYEVRFVMADEAGASRVRSLLRSLGCKPGAPYRKGRFVVQPVYGRDVVALLAPRLAEPQD